MRTGYSAGLNLDPGRLNSDGRIISSGCNNDITRITATRYSLTGKYSGDRAASGRGHSGNDYGIQSCIVFDGRVAGSYKLNRSVKISGFICCDPCHNSTQIRTIPEKCPHRSITGNCYPGEGVYFRTCCNYPNSVYPGACSSFSGWSGSPGFASRSNSSGGPCLAGGSYRSNSSGFSGRSNRSGRSDCSCLTSGSDRSSFSSWPNSSSGPCLASRSDRSSGSNSSCLASRSNRSCLSSWSDRSGGPCLAGDSIQVRTITVKNSSTEHRGGCYTGHVNIDRVKNRACRPGCYSGQRRINNLKRAHTGYRTSDEAGAAVHKGHGTGAASGGRYRYCLS